MTAHPALGREMRLTDHIDPWRARALHATMDLPGDGPTEGDALPHFWHWIYFLDARPARALGRDGHPATGEDGFIPYFGLPRRMWAGGRLRFHQPLPIGAKVEKRSTIDNVAEKSGRSGPLAFVTVRHDISGPDGLAITEHQDIVYRQDPAQKQDLALNAPKSPPKQAPTDEHRLQLFTCSTTMLFRYSALTFNGHRIHYDRDYAQGVEGYPGLIVHGPLIAQMLLAFAEAAPGQTTAQFEFRAASPAFDFEEITLCAKDRSDGTDLWARGPDGRLIMTASTSC
jgi:3-methylfumaryl-CoA hydratase